MESFGRLKKSVVYYGPIDAWAEWLKGFGLSQLFDTDASPPPEEITS